MILEFLAKDLQDAGLGTIGTDIFIHQIDENVVKGIVLRLPIAGIPTDYNLPGFYHATIQVIARSALQVEGDAMAASIKRALTSLQRRVYLNPDDSFAMQLNQMYLEKLPIVYPRSTGYSKEWSLNFYACFVIPE